MIDSTWIPDWCKTISQEIQQKKQLQFGIIVILALFLYNGYLFLTRARDSMAERISALQTTTRQYQGIVKKQDWITIANDIKEKYDHVFTPLKRAQTSGIGQVIFQEWMQQKLNDHQLIQKRITINAQKTIQIQSYNIIPFDIEITIAFPGNIFSDKIMLSFLQDIYKQNPYIEIRKMAMHTHRNPTIHMTITGYFHITEA